MRCPACDAPALTDDARFCVGCGAEYLEVDQRSGEEPVVVDTPKRPRRERRASVRERAPSAPSVVTSTEPAEVPVPVVIAGVVVLLVIVLLILLAG